MKQLKFGILTFHRCINYGSYWQARCLAKGLTDMGHLAEIMDHHSPRINLAEWKCAYQPVLPTPVPSSDYPSYRKKIEKFFSAFETLPLSPQFPVNTSDGISNYDAVVVGSDEVWNLFHPWYGRMPLFYGDGIHAQHLISYAASFGNYPASWGLEHAWAEKLRRFDLISVRDENAQLLVKNAIGIDAELVLDPCLQFDIDAGEIDHPYASENYIAVYGHNFSDTFIKTVKLVAAKKNQSLVSIGYRNDWADEQWITAGPHEFAQFISSAKSVATNFFHGCVFALHNQKPFVCEATSYRSNKVQGLLQTVGAEKHLMKEEATPETCLFLLNDRLSDRINQRIDELRTTSQAFLERALTLQQYHYA